MGILLFTEMSQWIRIVTSTVFTFSLVMAPNYGSLDRKRPKGATVPCSSGDINWNWSPSFPSRPSAASLFQVIAGSCNEVLCQISWQPAFVYLGTRCCTAVAGSGLRKQGAKDKTQVLLKGARAPQQTGNCLGSKDNCGYTHVSSSKPFRYLLIFPFSPFCLFASSSANCFFLFSAFAACSFRSLFSCGWERETCSFWLGLLAVVPF